MNVLFISQCSGNALTETRRILDQFAERYGDKVWQTPITEDGLAVVAKLLRKSARKNTAVACHWIHGRNHTDLLWIIGDKHRFGPGGAVPTNTSKQEFLPAEDNRWQTGEACRLLTAMAALWHDAGKIGAAFQAKLLGGSNTADAFRHEWLSARLFQSFVELSGNDDRKWLETLVNLKDFDDAKRKRFAKAWLKKLHKDFLDKSGSGDFSLPSPFMALPRLASSIAWLILSHHRLPVKNYNDDKTRSAIIRNPWQSIRPHWGYAHNCDKKGIAAKTWKIKEEDLPIFSKFWQARAIKIAIRLLGRTDIFSENWLGNTYVMHVARMGLMLADHVYSSRKNTSDHSGGESSYQPYANSSFELNAESGLKKRVLCQKLDEHLIGVEGLASSILWQVGRLRSQLPAVGLPSSRRLRKRSGESRFRWQDKAFDLAASLAAQSYDQGFFGINMASTGCGKTLANGRICHALSEGEGSRFTMALGLRTLTFQTGDVYRTCIGLGRDELAVLAGDQAIRELHEREAESDEDIGDNCGSESAEAFFQGVIQYEGSLSGPIEKWLKNNPASKALVSAPVLACTIDHLVPATEGIRGGRQIAPMLRLMTSDLVLDEPDDYDTDDLHALSRLVFWAGMLGSRVILSSATLAPAFAQGLFAAYQAGRKQYNANMGIDSALPVICAWFDEFACQAEEAGDEDVFAARHRDFVEKRLHKLGKLELSRKAQIISLEDAPADKDERLDFWTGKIRTSIMDLHSLHHTTDVMTGKRISFGLVRMANIEPLVKTVRSLAGKGIESGTHLHICCYHSQYPLLMRSGLESQLDRLLGRKCSDEEFLSKPYVRKLLTRSSVKDHIVLVMATPVAEVGRDHDYDWAIVEPSSLRSIIQLAGRVRRHRQGAIKEANIRLLDSNWKGLQNLGEKGDFKPVFCRPGFENELFRLDSHKLTSLLTEKQLSRLDASSRIASLLEPNIVNGTDVKILGNLAELEHAVLRELMLPSDAHLEKNIRIWWQDYAAMTGEIQRSTLFRRQSPQETFFWNVDDFEKNLIFSRLEEDGSATRQQEICTWLDAQIAENVSWLDETDYLSGLLNLADEKDISPQDCARRFGRVNLLKNIPMWLYHPRLGFFHKN